MNMVRRDVGGMDTTHHAVYHLPHMPTCAQASVASFPIMILALCDDEQPSEVIARYSLRLQRPGRVMSSTNSMHMDTSSYT